MEEVTEATMVHPAMEAGGAPPVTVVDTARRAMAVGMAATAAAVDRTARRAAGVVTPLVEAEAIPAAEGTPAVEATGNL